MKTARATGATKSADGGGMGRALPAMVLLLGLVGGCRSAAPAPAPTPVGEGEPAFLGVAYRMTSLKEYGWSRERAWRIDRVVPDSAAQRAGLRAGDLILRYDGRRVRAEDGSGAFQEYLQQYKRAGSPLRLKILRDETLWDGRRGRDAVELRNREQLLALLDKQAPEQTLRFRVRRKLRPLSFTVSLGTRSTLENIPDNQTLFPQYQELRHPTQTLGRALVQEHGLEEAWEDWSEQQDRDERWDDGRRLPLVRYLRRDPWKMLPVVERNTEGLRKQLQAGELEAALVSLRRDWLSDETAAPQAAPAQDFSLQTLRQLLERAHQARTQALAALDREQRDFLRRETPQMLLRLAQSYDTDAGRGDAVRKRHRRVWELGDRVDQTLLLQSLLWLSRAAAPRELRALAEQWRGRDALEKNPSGVSGPVLFSAESTAGRIVVGGAGANHYSGDFALIVDLGGDDLYRGKASGAGAHTGVRLLIDLAGDDEYSAARDFAQGGALLGASLLIDLEGDDVYRGRDFSQASAVFGGAALLDLEGDDVYSGGRFVQGVALFGAALLADFEGADQYDAELFAQGVGLTRGVGALVELRGDDFLRCGGRYLSSYRTAGVFRGSGQGLGIGFRHQASGGVGLLLEGGGADRLEAGNFAQGTGYFYGLGALRSFGPEDDLYRGSRYGQGSAAHSALGLMIEDGGDDRYHSTFGGVILGAAWDLAAAVFEDRSGDDEYGRSSLRFSAGSAAHSGFALFSDRDGRDVHRADTADKAWAQKDKANLGLFVDLGGDRDRHTQWTEDLNNASRKDKGGYGLRHDR